MLSQSSTTQFNSNAINDGIIPPLVVRFDRYNQTLEIGLRSVTNTAVCTTSRATGFSHHWVLISALCTVGVAFFSSNKDTWKSKRIHIAFSSYFTRLTRSLSISSASAHSCTSFRWLVSNGFPFFRLSYQLSEVGWLLSGFFLLIWLSRTTISSMSTISLYPHASA